ncbi:aminoglycoside phosphotransferase family protein [Tropicimonas aquimaris]|uniref:Aminoglycoside phosphotransferase family protein n=1 Tax=Tropicimonas aquimaris TaxID=914152 RepID=A0ABW3IW46_9RHOB
MSRADRRQAFLDRAGWGAAAAVPLAGDASTRRYERLTRVDGRTAVLMDAPPEAGNDVGPFLRIGAHLSGLGLSAPKVLAEDQDAGFLLLEDLGDALFARLIDEDPNREAGLYRAATDALLELHRHPAPDGLPAFGPPQMAKAVDLALTWYAEGCGMPPGLDTVARCERLVRKSLDAMAPARPVLALRDFHAENLIWLPERDGAARVGLLDFQDAFAGHPAYDLVSLLEDARRDVTPEVREAMVAHYIAGSGTDAAAFRTAFATSGAQRNLRILGVFARLSMHFGKPQYVALIPRVWAHLQADLADPALADLRDFLDGVLPAPDTDRLERIRSLCGTCPTP